MSVMEIKRQRTASARGSTPGQHNVLAAAATGFREFICQNGGDAENLFSSVGIAEAQLTNVNLPLDLKTYVSMMERAAAQTGKENFGLWYGQQFQPEMLGLIGGIAIASPTLGAALTNLAHLFPYHQQATHTNLACQDGLMRLEYRILDGGIVERRQDAELTLGMFVNVFRHCLGSQWAPEEIHCEHPKPEGWEEHEGAFSAPVHFGQGTNAVVFRKETLNCRMPKSNVHHLDLLCDQLLLISGGKGRVSLFDQVKGEIRRRLPEGIPYIETIAEAVGLPRWTLQRRLADYNLCYSEIVDLVRRELAERHVRQPYVGIVDIAEILGYSELSAFSRAFRRWFGLSPQKFRSTL
jgi:AraC-like DNA-binding protein